MNLDINFTNQSPFSSFGPETCERRTDTHTHTHIYIYNMLRFDGWIILRWIFRKWDVGYGLDGVG